ncbi:dynamin family protein [Nocardia macrotermitis]|uniref:Isoniazid-induced protein IniC n=1 Tax=Nocardia macrotermitis TaxID=2585198 RepID=A0A7K0DE26_9NOCA|nr:dynamin family protein [Nocardia macrotermitis]MQY24053.1 Isoniazid-induced protein IniC [Nocardia macrotermitis]
MNDVGVGRGIVPEARGLLAAARRAFEGEPRVGGLLAECAGRLEQPLRVALAGQLKAGKSTLLNALVGQDIAPTDATECTRMVTWYRHGATPRVGAMSADGVRADVVVRRSPGADGLPGAHGLTFDLSALRWPAGERREVDHLAVEWPAATLSRTTIIDTPGISSLSRAVSHRTERLLAESPEDTGDTLPAADAVVYLLRRLDDADIDFLERIGTGEQGPLGVIGVVSRADEIGSGRIDALHSARDVASRFAGELERTGLCQEVIPVVGLLAFAAATLRQREFDAFEALATVPVDDLALALLSADRFARPDLPLPVPPALRAHLAARFGLFGIRLAVTLIRLGARDSSTLATELTNRSGLDELRTVLDVQFAQRADQLKAHSALTGLSRILTAHSGTAADQLLPRVRTLLADVHGFAELRLLGHLRTDELPFAPDDLTELHRLIGGTGIAPHLRLGLPPDATPAQLRAAALAAIRKWRSRAAHPLSDQFTATACRTATRSAEGVLDLLQDADAPVTPSDR